jgi:hypothetical protein
LADIIGIVSSQAGVFMNRFRALSFVDDADKLDALLRVVLHDAPDFKAQD